MAQLLVVRQHSALMTIRWFIVGSTVLMLVMLSACRSPQPTAWSKDRILSVAYDTLREHKLSPDDFEAPDVGSKVGYLNGRRAWCVTFWPKSRVIGGEFSVAVFEDNGKVRVLPSL